VILYLDTTGEAEQLDAKDEGPGDTCFGGPGTANIVMQVHYYARGGTDIKTTLVERGGKETGLLWIPNARSVSGDYARRGSTIE
jgi:hypothetical protein